MLPRQLVKEGFYTWIGRREHSNTTRELSTNWRALDLTVRFIKGVFQQRIPPKRESCFRHSDAGVSIEFGDFYLELVHDGKADRFGELLDRARLA